MPGIGLGLQIWNNSGGGISYAANGIAPLFVSDFERDAYQVDGGGTTFASAYDTPTRSGLGSQLDSDGNLKWGAHNLLTYSEDLTGADWTAINASTTASSFTASADSNQHYIFNGITAVVGGTYTFEFKVSADSDGQYLQLAFGSGDVSGNPFANFDLLAGTIVADASSIATITPTSVSGEYIIAVTVEAASTAVEIILVAVGSSSATRLLAYDATGTTATYNVTQGRGYRSDLGGLVNNPDRGDSYVPTTASAVYLPRRKAYRYNGTSYVSAGILHESDARTNLVVQNNTFSDAAWTKSSVTVSQDATGPDGETSAWTVTGDGVTASSAELYRTFTVTGGNTYTWSWFAKAGTATWARVETFDGVGGADAFYDLSNGVVGSAGVGVVDYGIEDYGNGFYRIWLTRAVDGAATSARIQINQADADNTLTLGSAGKTLIVYGSQAEEASTISSYIPTNGSTANRTADTLTAPIANLPYPSGSPLAVSFAMKGRVTYADEGVDSQLTFFSWTENSSNRILTQFTTFGGFTGSPQFRQAAGGVLDTVQQSAPGSYSPGVNVSFSIASRHGTTFINGAVDGTALTADTTPTAFPDLSATDLDLAPTFNGFIEEFIMWGGTTGDIGDAGIAEASA